MPEPKQGLLRHWVLKYILPGDRPTQCLNPNTGASLGREGLHWENAHLQLKAGPQSFKEHSEVTSALGRQGKSETRSYSGGFS